MPSDAFAALQALTVQLGRIPTLEELLMGARDPSGRPEPPTEPIMAEAGSPAPQGSDVAADALGTARLREQELLAQVPELRKVREAILRRLLFEPLEDPRLGLGPPPAYAGSSGTSSGITSPFQIRDNPFFSPGNPFGPTGGFGSVTAAGAKRPGLSR